MLMNAAKVYISGKISGLSYDEAFANFTKTENIITNMGMVPVNPMNNGLPQEAQWHEHMGVDISLLLRCDAIMMHSNWRESKGARIEYSIAKEFGIIIMYQSRFERHSQNIELVKDAIHEVTGFEYKDYSVNCRNRDVYYSRMIFAYYCSKLGVDNKELERLLNKPNGTILRYLRVFDDEITYNKEFKQLSERVKNLLQTVSQ